MAALLLSLILCLSIEADSALARHYAAFSIARSGVALAALAVTAIIVSAFAAFGGGVIRPMLTPEARGLFLAVAMAMAGGALFFRPTLLAREDADEVSAVITFVRLFIAGAGSAAPLLIAAIACRFADPWFAGIGGGLGCVAGCVVGRVMLPDYPKPVRFFRYAAGGVMLLAAFLMAMSALRLM